MTKYYILLLSIFFSCKKEDLTTAKEDLPMEMRGLYKLIEAKTEETSHNSIDINNDGIESVDILGQITNSYCTININKPALFSVVTSNTIFLKFPRSSKYSSAKSTCFTRDLTWRYTAQRYVLNRNITLDLDNVNYNDGSWSKVKYKDGVISAKYQADFYDFKEDRFTNLIVNVKLKKLTYDQNKASMVAKNTPIIYSKDYPKK
ncbi:hypothetical protein K5X82_09175 [Halosquirtibacter xylanolyticus]|uniref:hypothetical protein n=1 Tax=Halosquirtibacter xylanolyticus TaxID=3374599 RepID=UPI0037496A6E|nr:hypothetical protein K5X82_09175 [Prolixibacteraceae bacterium]